MLDRRKFLIGAAALGVADVSAHAAPFEWQQAAPSETGFAPDFAEKLDQFIASGRVTNIHGIIVARRGRIVLERYYEGDDQVRDSESRWGVARVAFTAERRHDLRSITKSVVGLLYGIALSEGKVPPLDAPLLAQFPQYTDLPDLWQRRRWTIAHAITMTLGTEWDEDISYEDPRNGQTAMEAAPDRYRYVLEQPIVAVVGERWTYCGGATALIGKIIENGTTMRVLFCSTRSGLARPNGGQGATASAISPPASACGRAIWRALGRWSSTAARRGSARSSRRRGSRIRSSRRPVSTTGASTAITGMLALCRSRVPKAGGGRAGSAP
jgi:hypothetical protein